ncbi:MAG TPA: hypothetical protein VJK07_01055 [Candidatus Nanoarchaeia archaeon]|nr:hypothetical protein [Candidatus Nanoarchaeia archaeon]
MTYKAYGQKGHVMMDYNGVPVIDMPVRLGTNLLEPVKILNKTVEQGIINPDERELTDMKRALVAIVRTMRQETKNRLIGMVFDDGDNR